MPRRSRRVSPTQSHRRGRREHQPNVFMGPVPEDKERDDEDLLLDELDDGELAETAEEESAADAVAVPSPAARGKRAQRRRAASARRGAGARNRAAVFTQNLPSELKKLGVMVGGTAIILGILTVVLG